MSEEYLNRQRRFWNADEQTAKFGRVDVYSRSEKEYEQLADRDIRLVLEGIHPLPTWTILELGCGIGRLLTRMRMRVSPAKLIGVDISDRMLRYAGAAVGSDSGVELHVTNGSDLRPIATESVDFAYSNDVFIHIHDLDVVESYFAELHRVLRRDGLFRFNVRSLELSRMFSNSLGGLCTKTCYALRLWSPLHRHTGLTGFDGFYYRASDARRLLNRANLDIVTMARSTEPDGGRFWITARKP